MSMSVVEVRSGDIAITLQEKSKKLMQSRKMMPLFSWWANCRGSRDRMCISTGPSNYFRTFFYLCGRMFFTTPGVQVKDVLYN